MNEKIYVLMYSLNDGSAYISHIYLNLSDAEVGFKDECHWHDDDLYKTLADGHVGISLREFIIPDYNGKVLQHKDFNQSL